MKQIIATVNQVIKPTTRQNQTNSCQYNYSNNYYGDQVCITMQAAS